MKISPDQFRAALGRFATGVTVVTTRDRSGELHGITVSAFCSVSLEPPLILICIEKATYSYSAIAECNFFAVNILANNQKNLSEQFATPLPDKFANVRYYESSTGVPLLNGALANLECRLKHSYDGGDHTIFVGEVENATLNEGDPLLHFLGNYESL